MQEELHALVHNGTWTLAPHPAGANVVTGKWVFKHKFHSVGLLLDIRPVGWYVDILSVSESTMMKHSVPL
jgi:hypothetical protein